MITYIAYMLYSIGAVGIFTFLYEMGRTWSGPFTFLGVLGVLAVAIFWPISVLVWLIVVCYSIVSDAINDLRKKNETK